MNYRLVVALMALLVIAFAVTACGAAATPTPTPKPTVAASPTVPPTQPPPPTPTPMPPTATPLPPTPTPVPPQVTSKQQINLRQGPGTNFSIAGTMPINTNAVIVGKNEDGKWLQIAYPEPARPSWVATAFVTVTGSIDKLPVVAVAPQATPTGPAPTKAAAATPTISFPPAKGIMAFVSYSDQQKSYVLNNLVINPRNYSGYKLIGPSPVDLRISTNMPPFAWSPDGTRVAYVFGPNGLTDVLRITDRAGNEKDVVSHGAISAPGGISSPTWSPDGTRVAYVGIDNNYGTQFIYTIGAEGGTEQRFFAARGNESFRGVTWGKTWLLFVSNLSGHSEIWRLNGDGSGPLQLTNDKRENGSPAWSPDGKQFAYYSKQADNSYQIMLANADGTGVKKLTSAGNNWSPVWSPDGNHITFASTRGGSMQIWVMDKTGGNPQLLTDKFGADGQLPGSWR
jgi:Tol biopolymer transport system component